MENFGLWGYCVRELCTCALFFALSGNTCHRFSTDRQAYSTTVGVGHADPCLAFLSPTYQTVGHECTVDEAAPPKYLLPWTSHCVKCRGEVLQQYGRIRYTEESVTRHPIALISMRCHRCLALYGYDTVPVGEGEDEEV